MGAAYKNYKAGDLRYAAPGYVANAFLLPVDWLDTEAPVDGNAAAGNRKTISTNHTVLAGKGAISVYCAPKTVEGDGELIGEPLAKRFQWKPKIVVPGDSAILWDMVDGLINKSFLLFIEDAGNCQNGVHSFVQFGCDCDPAIISEGSFKSGSSGEGRKQYEFTLESICKFFYEGIIPELADGVEVIEP